jgi:DNA polymerase alpha subunit B
MADSTVEELNALFSAPGAQLEPDVVYELESIMRLHSIPPQELFYKWESYSIKMGSDDLKLNLPSARALKKDVQDGLEREIRSKTLVRSADKRTGGTARNITSNGDVFGMWVWPCGYFQVQTNIMIRLDGLVPNTPRTGTTNRTLGGTKRKFETPSMSRVKAEPTSSPPDFKTPYKPGERPNGVTVPFHDRANAGQTVEILNDQLPAAEPPIAPYAESRIKLTSNSDTKTLSYKPMAMKSSEASEVLDERIDEFLQLVQAHHNLEDSAFGSAASQSINEIVAVGRIASDSSDGKLNTASLVLETSRRMGAGLRIPLKMGTVQGFQFFPGQIVALRGINVSGEEFTVNEILDAPLLPVAASTPAGLEAHVQRLRGGPDAMDSDSPPPPLNVLLGVGPYTADDNLDFEPLHALCSRAADSYADALILAGPFLDIDHPLLASGDFDLPDEALTEPDTATMVTIFRHLIVPAFQQLVSSNPNIIVLLIPSVRDAISQHVSWPQEAFSRKGTGLPKAVRIVGNPMTLSLNEIVTAISSQDILYELRHEEVTGGKLRDPNLLSRLPRHLIEQRHFFPLYPPVDRPLLPKTGTTEGVPAGAMLDLSYLKLGEILNVRPDMLIIPSALPPFAKVRPSDQSVARNS